MIGFDLHWWETVMLVSLAIAAIAAVAVGVATTAVVRLQRESVRDADLRIAEVSAGAAKANERAANAELKAEELKQKMAPRTIDRKAFLDTLDGKPKVPVEILYTGTDPDSIQLSWQLLALLSEAGWQVTHKPIPPQNPTIGFSSLIPSAIAFGGQVAGISVVAKEHPETMDAKPNPQFLALFDAIFKATGAANGGRDESMPIGALRIVVSPKTP